MPGEDLGGSLPRVATAPTEGTSTVRQQQMLEVTTTDPDVNMTAVKTAAELAAERKREKQLEEERMIRYCRSFYMST